MLRLLAAISLLILAAEASNTGRELLASGSSSATIGVSHRPIRNRALGGVSPVCMSL